MKAISRVMALWCAGWAVLIATPVHGDTMVDNFESYADGQIVGPSAISSPWRRFGGATNDNVVATGHEKWVIRGSRSALYGLVWPGPFGATRYVFDQATDLSTYSGVTVQMRSDKSSTHTQVKLAISNGRTTFVTVAEHPLTAQVQALTFKLGPTALIRTAGEDGYHELVQGVWSIGFDFRSIESEGYETVVFDNVVLTTSADQQPQTKVSALE